VTRKLAFGFVAVCVFAYAEGRDLSVAEAWLGKKKGPEAKRIVQVKLASCPALSTPAAIPSCFDASEDASGYWVGGADPGDCLRVRPTSEGAYRVAYLAESHDSTLRYRRSATEHRNVLTLSGPVLDAADACIERLYAVESLGQRWLIPESTLAEVSTFVQAKGCAALAPNWIRGNIFQPASSDAASFCSESLKVQE